MPTLSEERFEQILTEKLAPLATKQDVQDSADELARMTGEGFAGTEQRFDEIDHRLDVTEQLKIFERKFHRLEEALQIKL